MPKFVVARILLVFIALVSTSKVASELSDATFRSGWTSDQITLIAIFIVSVILLALLED